MSKRIAISRRGAIKALGGLTLAPLLSRIGPGGLFALSGHHPMVPVQEEGPSWRAAVFDDRQTEAVKLLTEMIIPETDTPGALAVKVYQHIDYALSLEEPARRADFLEGVAWMDRKSGELFGGNFAEISPDARHAILTVVASDRNTALSDQVGVRFFKDLKERTVVGYYGSEAGMFEELLYEGNDFLSEYPGCQHAAHLDWEPAKGGGDR